MIHEAQAQRLAMEHVQGLIDLVAEFVEQHPDLYGLGDGAGGWLHQDLDEALAIFGQLPQRRDQHVPVGRVDRLATRDGWTCHYCAHPLGWGHHSVRPPEVDHLVPRCQGGGDRLGNLVLACPPCNNAKSGRTPMQWLGRFCCEVHS